MRDKNHVELPSGVSMSDEVLEALTISGGTSLLLRRRLAGEAYARTAAYDAAIATWFAEQRAEAFPQRLTVAGSLRQTLSATTQAALDQAVSPQDWNTLYLSSPEFMH